MPEGRYTLGYANKKNWLSKVVVASYEDNSSIKQDSLWESREYFWGPRHDKANS